MPSPTAIPKPPRMPKRALTHNLRELGAQIVTIDPETGDPVTRQQQLAELLWKQALGYEEKSINDDGTTTLTKHPPVAWAQTYIFDRIDGKVAPTNTEEKPDGIRTVDRVRDLARDRVNTLGRVAAGPPAKKDRPSEHPRPESAPAGDIP